MYGKQLSDETDHKPLESIFKKKHSFGTLKGKKNYARTSTICSKNTVQASKQIQLADVLKRDWANKIEHDTSENLKVSILLPMTLDAKNDLVQATKNDPELQVLIKTIRARFPNNMSQLPKEIKHYFNFKEELSYVKGLVFKVDKIEVLQPQIQRMLQNIYIGHLGIQS